TSTTTSTASVPRRPALPTASTTTTTTLPPFTVLGALPPGRPLSGKVIGIDPGHNGLNYTDPGYLDQQVWNGRAYEDCDTTGTQTSSGYSEAQFNFNVATYLASDLENEGAGVVLTRSSNNGIGPCVDQRAEILNEAQSVVAVDIHADGGPPSGRGFAILLPVADGPNDAVIASSQTFGEDVLSNFSATGMPVSTYDGTGGFSYRDDLAGLNLTTVPKVLIECGNMQNSTDASLLTSTAFQQSAAVALADAITAFVG
ncbi:MAG TPA: N-acetylmuramoyl-L-alanine amidase, partial [Acidimicrobiaceae bacterium]|nr:N-acetylmuramoyl-L-alanine amidase [Acidimicrobiaceae bacterium]